MLYRRGAGIVLLRNLWDYTGNYCTLPIFFFLHLTSYTLHPTPYTQSYPGCLEPQIPKSRNPEGCQSDMAVASVAGAGTQLQAVTLIPCKGALLMCTLM
jgi:hypothetical protein